MIFNIALIHVLIYVWHTFASINKHLYMCINSLLDTDNSIRCEILDLLTFINLIFKF